MIAFAGHIFAQTPHLLHDITSTILGLPFVPSSKTPNGQTPTQISPEQGEHLAYSIRIIELCFPMASQQLNKPLEYICCALSGQT